MATRACWCAGALQPGPNRTVTHGAMECRLDWTDGTAPVVLRAPQKCPKCLRVREFVEAHGGLLCSDCTFNPHRTWPPVCSSTPRPIAGETDSTSNERAGEIQTC